MCELPLGLGLPGKRVVVTGGAAGIGLATAQRFSEVGADVVIIDRDSCALKNAVRELKRVVGIEYDVSDPDAVADAFDEVEHAIGGVDVLIANAGISTRTGALEISPREWQDILATNLSGVFYCAQEAARRQMKDRPGVILMTASTNGMRAYVNYAHYNATKGGVIALARTMALEFAPHIRVNAVCPGYVLTPMHHSECSAEIIKELNDDVIPLGRHAKSDEIAALFLYLASDWGAYMTGQTIVIDGGELA